MSDNYMSNYNLSQFQILTLIQLLEDVTNLLESLDTTNVVPPVLVVSTPSYGTYQDVHSTIGTAVGSYAELKAVLGNGNATRINGILHIHLSEDIISPGTELLMQGLKDVVINGNGFAIKRRTGQINNHMIHLIGCSNVTFEFMVFDDDNDGVHGPLGGQTKHMIWIRNSTNIKFDNTELAYAKGYTLYVQNVEGFIFTQSSIHDAGVIGLYVGHSEQYSSRVLISNNHFYDNSTNALALLGVGGETQNIVQFNLFERNHKYGRWAVAAKYGDGYTGGGQMYIAAADNVLIDSNVIKDGLCINGYHNLNNTGNGDVHGIELSELAGASIRVKRIIISNNQITDNDSTAIYQNANTTLDHTTVIEDNNTLIGNGSDNKISVRGATIK